MQPPTDIHDDLHGTVRLEPHERAIIDPPWFQRLRRIKQLGLAEMVFPGAEHTRFAHSVGVFHLAGRIADGVCSTILTQKDRSELRAAALLHDVGHFPFSHSLESVYEAQAAKELEAAKPKTAEQALAGTPAGPQDKQGGFADFGPDDPAAFHERLGQRVVVQTDVDGGVTRALEQIPAGVDPTRVGEIIVAQHPSMLLNQIVKSDLDVDQLDYLLRDAKATGSRYGQYDIDYLVECLEVVCVEGQPILCVHVRGLHVVEHYVLAKYFYYLCILSHKTRCVIEGMLQSVTSQLIEATLLPTWDELLNWVAKPEFHRFDDSYVLEAMRRACTDGKVDQCVAEAIRMLLRRELPKVTRERHTLVRPGTELPRGLHELPDAHDWNAVIKDAAQSESVCLQNAPILRPAREVPIKNEDELRDVILDQSAPIRIFIEKPFEVPPNTLVLSATTVVGAKKGQITLLECLAHTSMVAALRGFSTYVQRSYRPHPGSG